MTIGADVRFGEAREMRPAWEHFARGDLRSARVEARRVAAAPDPVRREAEDLLARTDTDVGHVYAVLLVACVWLVAMSLVYFR